MNVATHAVQLYGAAGISNEYPINRYFRAKVLQIIEGANHIKRNIIAAPSRAQQRGKRDGGDRRLR